MTSFCRNFHIYSYHFGKLLKNIIVLLMGLLELEIVRGFKLMGILALDILGGTL
jgi:hypothetical protein